jgi:thioredoxin reductase (NADPH)
MTDRLDTAKADAFAQAFPTLTPEQMERIQKRGRLRPVQPGDVLVEAGDHAMPFFVVKSGRVEVFLPSAAGDSLITVQGAGEFTGEVNMLSGGRALGRLRVSEPGEVIELDREHLLNLIQSDGELSEILMRAFIYRRVGLIERHLGAVLIGSNHCAGTLRIREFLTRNGQPFNYIDLDQDSSVQELLDRVHVTLADIPVLLFGNMEPLRNPTNERIAERIGLYDAIDQAKLRDIVIVGAGPSGLAAAVYGASEGLDVLVLEPNAPGGQAGSSSKIENYLGFPTGISGQDLAAAAYRQAQKFGAQVMIAKGAKRLACDRKPYAIEIEGGQRLAARTVVIASGAAYRRLSLDNISRFEGAGIYYGATQMEAQLCREEEVAVVGGGNSAGQAAVFLAQSSKHVHMVVRSGGLADTMSRYLINRIEGNPKITRHTQTEITAIVMTGADPCTSWLEGCVALDAKGFIKTGPDLSADDLAAARWPLTRPPHLLETSLPGVFAVGDVRCASVKRVASAVGEGSIAIAFVHQVLHE